MNTPQLLQKILDWMNDVFLNRTSTDEARHHVISHLEKANVPAEHHDAILDASSVDDITHLSEELVAAIAQVMGVHEGENVNVQLEATGSGHHEAVITAVVADVTQGEHRHLPPRPTLR